MRLLPLLLLLTSCYLHAPLEEPSALQPVPTSEPASAPAASLAPPTSLAAPTAGRFTARVQSVQDECSGMGGIHVVFEILNRWGNVVALAHHGDHAYYPPTPFCVGDLYTVEYTPSEKPQRYGNPGWCIFTPELQGSAKPIALEKGAPRKLHVLPKEEGGGSWETCEPSLR